MVHGRSCANRQTSAPRNIGSSHPREIADRSIARAILAEADAYRPVVAGAV